jgi:mRNA interferase RelE/StbE
VTRAGAAGPFALRISYDAQRVLTQAPASGLSSRVAWQAYEFVTGPLLFDPTGLGVPLGAALTGVWSARQAGYRVLYEVDPDRREVTVLVIRPEPATP